MVDAITFLVLPVLMAITVQILKPLLPSSTVDGVEMGPRRWLPLIVVSFGAVIGTALGFYVGDDPVLWTINGFISGAASIGIYSLGKMVAPDHINSDGWVL